MGWIVFAVVVGGVLTLDLGLFHRKAREVTIRQALAWSGFWVALALAFNAGIYVWRGPQAASQFLTGYLIEKSLSLDNIFVFYLVLSHFRVQREYHHKVLFWGIIGALTMRIVFILAGIALIDEFEWIVYPFGAFLVFSGTRMFRKKEIGVNPERNPVLRLSRRILPVTEDFQAGRFFVRRDAGFLVTPLFIVLLVVETTDIVFAVDSIPAILAITADPFIVYTSNVFAILGLRALYFVLAGMIGRFEYLHYGLGAMLVFVGIKMTLSHIVPVPLSVTLSAIVLILGLSILVSLRKTKKNQRNVA
jgi:tellurite resistance protein TerC